MPGWLGATIIYWAGRAVSIGLALAFAFFQGANNYTAARPDYISFANMWDARWFEFIASAGYPHSLPMVNDHVTENAWAFLPIFPYFVSGLATLAHVSWQLTAVIVSLLAGWGSSLVTWRLMRRTLTETQSRWAVAFYSFSPVSGLFGFGYAESLFLLFLSLCLLFLVERRYLALGILMPLLAFTRPGMVALALTVAGHFAYRWWDARRGHGRFSLREQSVVIFLIAWAVILGFAWLGIAGLVTGNPAAYLETELAWRSSYVGYIGLAPGTPWFRSGEWWLGQPLGTIIPLNIALVMFALPFFPAARRLGPDLRWWIFSYWTYLFLVFFPQSSTFRLLMPLFPVVGLLAQIRHRWLRWALLSLSVLGQVAWLGFCWAIDGQDWTPP